MVRVMNAKSGEEATRRPRGRPRSFDRDESLDAAVLVFWKKGYDGSSIQDLTQAMGINRPSLYATFGNKRDLFMQAIDRYAATHGNRAFSAFRLILFQTPVRPMAFFMAERVCLASSRITIVPS